MGEQVLLVVAREGPGPDGDVVAGALNLVGSHAIFGRNWGCHPAVYVKHLHFETCYYQARCAFDHRSMSTALARSVTFERSTQLKSSDEQLKIRSLHCMRDSGV